MTPYRKTMQRAVVLGHYAISDPVLVALKLSERIRKEGTQTLWIADDGCFLADDPTRKTAQSADPAGIVGKYTGAISADGIAADIEFTRSHFADSALRARGYRADDRRRSA